MTDNVFDIQIEDAGTRVRIRPLTDRGRRWFRQHVDYERESDGAIVVDSIAVRDIVSAAEGAGMNVHVSDES